MRPTRAGTTTTFAEPGQITASDFEVVQVSAICTGANVPEGFTANPSSVLGDQPVTLTWSVSDYNIVTPQAGPVRGNSIVITPAAIATYKLESTNQYCRSQASVKVTVVIR
ncbi:MAG TPA: hypothetical protein VKB88_44290 [Bryobacteraceae bacterium]|nr:hypothetical protein [Bryobacteraceae bacterium]